MYDLQVHTMNQYINNILAITVAGLFFLMLAMLPQQSIAAPNTLYEATIPAPVLGPAQPMLLQEALRTVLVQLSGSEKTLTLPAVQKATESPESYIKRYSYKEDQEKKRFLQVKFDEVAINELLQKINIPILARPKSATTVWMVIAHDQDNPHWVSEDSEAELFHQINTQAKQRALSLMFPLLDLADTEAVSEQVVWTDNFSGLQTASKRYHSEAIWVAKMSKQPSGWYGQWTLLTGGVPQTWDSSNTNLTQLCQEAMDELGQRLSRTIIIEGSKIADTQDSNQSLSANATTTTDTDPHLTTSIEPNKENTRIRLSVVGIKDIAHYAKLQDYLKSLPGVKEVETLTVNPEQTIFDVVATSRADLISTIAAGKILLQNEPSGNIQILQPENNGMLNYKIVEVM